MRLTHHRWTASLAFIPVLLAGAALASEGNWLLEGRWVREPLPCQQEQTGDINPGGLEFSAESVVIRAPPLQPALPDMRLEARYEVAGDVITVRLSGPAGALSAMEFKPAADGRAMDAAGYAYRRCGGPTS